MEVIKAHILKKANVNAVFQLKVFSLEETHEII